MFCQDFQILGPCFAVIYRSAFCWLSRWERAILLYNQQQSDAPIGCNIIITVADFTQNKWPLWRWLILVDCNSCYCLKSKSIFTRARAHTYTHDTGIWPHIWTMYAMTYERWMAELFMAELVLSQRTVLPSPFTCIITIWPVYNLHKSFNLPTKLDKPGFIQPRAENRTGREMVEFYRCHRTYMHQRFTLQLKLRRDLCALSKPSGIITACQLEMG